MALNLGFPSVRPSAIALGLIFTHGTELAILAPAFGETYKRAKASSANYEELVRSKEAASAATLYGTSFLGAGLQAYSVAALLNATGTLSYKGAAYLGTLVMLATSAPIYISQLAVEKKTAYDVTVAVLGKAAETVGLALVLTWWGTFSGFGM